MAQLVKNLPVNAGDARDLGLIPVSGRSPGEGNGNPLQYSCLDNPMDKEPWQATVQRVVKSWTQLNRLSPQVALVVKNHRRRHKTCVGSLGCEDPLEQEVATHSSTLAWKIPWTEEPGGLQSMEPQRVGHDWALECYLIMLYITLQELFITGSLYLLVTFTHFSRTLPIKTFYVSEKWFVLDLTRSKVCICVWGLYPKAADWELASSGGNTVILLHHFHLSPTFSALPKKKAC